MEEFLKIIYTRRSVREYSEKDIDNESIEKIIRAAVQAPSARNSQPWHFIIIRNKETLTQLSEALPYGKMLRHSPVAITVCADPSLNRSKEALWPQDCSASTQNILLAARALNIGSVWIAVYPYSDRMNAVRNILKIPENIVPFSIVALGYPKNNEAFYEAQDRYKKERIHVEVW